MQHGTTKCAIGGWALVLATAVFGFAFEVEAVDANPQPAREPSLVAPLAR
jgi:hypothetical protein